MHILRILIVFVLAGCADPACRPMIEAQLYFGLTDKAGFVDFLDREVTPRFPEGLTVVEAAGRWRAPTGQLTQERSKLVIIVAASGNTTLDRLQAIRTAYKARFSQQSVGLVMEPVCGNF